MQNYLWEMSNSMQMEILLAWVPSHSGIGGSEAADKEANKERMKEGTRGLTQWTL